MGDGTGCDNMTAVLVKFKPGFKTMKDCVTGLIDNSESSSSSTEVSSESGPKRAAEEHVSSETGELPTSKKIKLDNEVSETAE